MQIITVSPTSPGRFSAHAGDRLLVASSPTPLLAAARVLLVERLDPATVLEMRHAGRDIVAMTGRLDQLAGLTVRETPNEGPYFARYSAPEPEMPPAAEGAPRQRPSPLNPSATSSEPSKPILEPTFE